MATWFGLPTTTRKTSLCSVWIKVCHNTTNSMCWKPQTVGLFGSFICTAHFIDVLLVEREHISLRLLGNVGIQPHSAGNSRQLLWHPWPHLWESSQEDAPRTSQSSFTSTSHLSRRFNCCKGCKLNMIITQNKLISVLLSLRMKPVLLPRTSSSLSGRIGSTSPVNQPGTLHRQKVCWSGLEVSGRV
jgi:hypothetical protein